MCRSRSEPRSSATGRASCTSLSEISTRAALAQISPELANEQRRPARELADGRDELAGRFRAGRCANERSHLLVTEPPEREPCHRVEACELGERVRERGPDLLASVAVRRDHQHPRLRCRPAQVTKHLERLVVSPVDVVRDEQQRLQPAGAAQQLGCRAPEQVAVGRGFSGGERRAGQPLELRHEQRQQPAAIADAFGERLGVADAKEELEPLPQRLVRVADRGIGGAVEHEHVSRRRFVRQLAHEPCLAASRLRREQHEAALAALGLLEQGAQHRAAPPRGRRTETAAQARARRAERPARPRAVGYARSVERRVLSQDPPFEQPQLGARLEPELVERGARGAVGLERLRLPARPVERQHQLPAQPLALRLLRDQDLELADELGVTAEREVGLDPLLERRQPQILQPPGLDPRERLLAELRQRRPAPQAERLAQQARRARRARRRAPRRRAARTAAGRPRPARPRAGSPAAASRSIPSGSSFRSRETYPWSALTAVSGGLLAPELVDQPLAREHPVRVQQQEREQRALLRRVRAEPARRRPEPPASRAAGTPSRLTTVARLLFIARARSSQRSAPVAAFTGCDTASVTESQSLSGDGSRRAIRRPRRDGHERTRRRGQRATGTAEPSAAVCAGRASARGRAPLLRDCGVVAGRRADLHGLVGAGEPRADGQLGGARGRRRARRRTG